MFVLPSAVEPLLRAFSPAFFAPTFARFALLAVAAIVGFGRRSVSRLLWIVGDLRCGDPSSYHRVFSKARWSLWPLAKVLCQAILAYVPEDQAIRLAVDDTVTEHRGKKVYGKAAHRDPVRSSWNHTALRLGHRWAVLSILVQFPFAPRPWALPIMAALCRTPGLSKQQKLRHKTPCQVAQGLVLQLLRWFPRRRFLLIGDWGFGHHQFAYRLLKLSQGRCQIVARIRGDTRLFARPNPKARQYGRPRVRGPRLPSPKAAGEAARQLRLVRVKWYGNQQREVRCLSAVGNWYWGRGKGRGLILPIRWVYVQDPEANRCDCFFTTELAMKPEQIIENFAMRWALEVTFQECRAHLGLQSPRQRSRNSVLRTTPCLFGLFSVISICYARLLASGHAPRRHGTPCYHKQHITFSDALYDLRRQIWQELLLAHRPQSGIDQNSPTSVQEVLLEYLTAAA